MLSTFVSVVKLMCMDRIHVVGQKYNSALEGSCSDVIDRDVELHKGFQAT